MRFAQRDPFTLENPNGRTLTLRPERVQALADYLCTELENSMADRRDIERVWSRARRHYYAVPDQETREVPYVNASNKVAPLAQIASDAIFATVFSIATEASPILTVRATNDLYARHAKAIQLRVDAEINAESEATTGGLHWNFIPALYHGGKDCVKLGTAFWHIGWFQQIIKGRYTRVETSGARIEPVPIENVYVPGAASYDLQNLPWIALKYDLRPAELQERAQREGWDLDGVHASGSVSTQRAERERFSRQQATATRDDINDVFRIYCCFDIDDDGETEDLIVYYNHTGSYVMKVDWAPYDHRPGVVAHFDIEEYLFYGRGVPAILFNMTDIATDALNTWFDNAMLANTRIFTGPPQAQAEDTVLIWPGRYIPSTNPDQVREIRISDVHESLPELLQVSIGFGERATGINDLSTARPAQIPGRTPATTTLQMLSQVSQRHTPFFSSFRSAAASLVKECLYREQERLLRGDEKLEAYLIKTLGQEQAGYYIAALKDDTFDNGCTIELTVTTAQINQEMERNNALLVANFYRQYIQDLVGAIVALKQNPDPVLAEVMKKAIIASNEFMEKFLRTFSSVSNPQDYIVDPNSEIEQIQAQAAQGLAAFGGSNGVAFSSPGEAGSVGQSSGSSQTV